jgi:predicted nucleic acid-binding Zn ribbon protein
MTGSSPQSLASVIDALFHQLGLEKKLKQYDIVDIWPSVVGSQIAQVTSVDKIQNNVLVIKVSAAPWRTELTFRRKEILEKVREAMNSDSIKDIRFR